MGTGKDTLPLESPKNLNSPKRLPIRKLNPNTPRNWKIRSWSRKPRKPKSRWNRMIGSDHYYCIGNRHIAIDQQEGYPVGKRSFGVKKKRCEHPKRKKDSFKKEISRK
jgi:hypothetical protein